MKSIKTNSPITNKDNTKKVRSISTSKIIHLYEDEIGIDVAKYFEDLDEIEIRECIDTGYRYYWPSSIISDEMLYDQLKEKLPDYYPKWKWENDQVLPLLKDTKKILEIGCGNGFFLERVIAEFKNIEALGIDLNEKSIETAKSKGIDALKVDLNEMDAKYLGYFDCIVCFQLLEHINDINSFYKSVYKLLKPGGKFIVVVPYNNPYIFKSDVYHTLNLPPHHMGLWNDNSLIKVGEYFGFKSKDITIERLSKWGYDFYRYYSVNKDKYYRKGLPFKKTFDSLYERYLRKFNLKYSGQNIICVYEK